MSRKLIILTLIYYSQTIHKGQIIFAEYEKFPSKGYLEQRTPTLIYANGVVLMADIQIMVQVC